MPVCPSTVTIYIEINIINYIFNLIYLNLWFKGCITTQKVTYIQSDFAVTAALLVTSSVSLTGIFCIVMIDLTTLWNNKMTEFSKLELQQLID